MYKSPPNQSTTNNNPHHSHSHSPISPPPLPPPPLESPLSSSFSLHRRFPSNLSVSGSVSGSSSSSNGSSSNPGSLSTFSTGSGSGSGARVKKRRVESNSGSSRASSGTATPPPSVFSGSGTTGTNITSPNGSVNEKRGSIGVAGGSGTTTMNGEEGGSGGGGTTRPTRSGSTTATTGSIITKRPSISSGSISGTTRVRPTLNTSSLSHSGSSNSISSTPTLRRNRASISSGTGTTTSSSSSLRNSISGTPKTATVGIGAGSSNLGKEAVIGPGGIITPPNSNKGFTAPSPPDRRSTLSPRSSIGSSPMTDGMMASGSGNGTLHRKRASMGSNTSSHPGNNTSSSTVRRTPGGGGSGRSGTIVPSSTGTGAGAGTSSKSKLNSSTSSTNSRRGGGGEGLVSSPTTTTPNNADKGEVLTSRRRGWSIRSRRRSRSGSAGIGTGVGGYEEDEDEGGNRNGNGIREESPGIIGGGRGGAGDGSGSRGSVRGGRESVEEVRERNQRIIDNLNAHLTSPPTSPSRPRPRVSRASTDSSVSELSSIGTPLSTDEYVDGGGGIRSRGDSGETSVGGAELGFAIARSPSPKKVGKGKGKRVSLSGSPATVVGRSPRMEKETQRDRNRDWEMGDDDDGEGAQGFARERRRSSVIELAKMLEENGDDVGDSNGRGRKEPPHDGGDYYEDDFDGDGQYAAGPSSKGWSYDMSTPTRAELDAGFGDEDVTPRKSGGLIRPIRKNLTPLATSGSVGSLAQARHNASASPSKTSGLGRSRSDKAGAVMAGTARKVLRDSPSFDEFGKLTSGTNGDLVSPPIRERTRKESAGARGSRSLGVERRESKTLGYRTSASMTLELGQLERDKREQLWDRNANPRPARFSDALRLDDDDVREHRGLPQRRSHTSLSHYGSSNSLRPSSYSRRHQSPAFEEERIRPSTSMDRRSPNRAATDGDRTRDMGSAERSFGRNRSRSDAIAPHRFDRGNTPPVPSLRASAPLRQRPALPTHFRDDDAPASALPDLGGSRRNFDFPRQSPLDENGPRLDALARHPRQGSRSPIAPKSTTSSVRTARHNGRLDTSSHRRGESLSESFDHLGELGPRPREREFGHGRRGESLSEAHEYVGRGEAYERSPHRPRPSSWSKRKTGSEVGSGGGSGGSGGGSGGSGQYKYQRRGGSGNSVFDNDDGLEGRRTTGLLTERSRRESTQSYGSRDDFMRAKKSSGGSSNGKRQSLIREDLSFRQDRLAEREVGSKQWLNELLELRERVGYLEDTSRPLSRNARSAAGSSDRGSTGDGTSRLRDSGRDSGRLSNPRDRERTLRRSQNSQEEEPPLPLSPLRRGGSVATRRRGAFMDSPIDTPLSAGLSKSFTVHGTSSGLNNNMSRSESARSVSSEHHRLLTDSMNHFERHFTSPISSESSAPESVDLVKRMASITNATSKLNAGLRTLVNSAAEAQMEIGLDETHSGASISSLAHFEKAANQLLRLSNDQVRSTTEVLIAFTRVERERDRLRREANGGPSSRPGSRAGSARASTPLNSAKPGSPIVNASAGDPDYTSNRPGSGRNSVPLRDPLEGIERDDNSRNLSRRRGGGSLSARPLSMVNPRSPILHGENSPMSDVHPSPLAGRGLPEQRIRSPLASEMTRPLEEAPELTRPVARRAKTSSTSQATVRATNSTSPLVSPQTGTRFPRAPAAADSQLEMENAIGTMSPREASEEPEGRSRTNSESSQRSDLDDLPSRPSGDSDSLARRHTVSTATARSLARLTAGEDPSLPDAPDGKPAKRRISSGPSGAAAALRQGISGLMGGSRSRRNTMDKEAPLTPTTSSSLQERSAERRKEVEAILRRTVHRSAG